MKRGLTIIALGLVAGLFAHSIYYNTFKPCEDDTLECQLSWIQDYLSLSTDQYDIVLAMHRDRQPEITHLQEQILTLENRLAALESERIENDRIDFIAFYSYLQEKVDLDKTCDSSMESFLTKVGSIMEPDQKERFNRLIHDFKATAPEGS